MSAAGSFHLKRVLANAGCGKTFELSSQFLTIANDGIARGDPARLETILATTFTRAAAAQIRDRILLRAAEAVLDAEKCKDLASDIRRCGGIGPLDAGELLSQLVQRIDRLEIRTIDGFLARVASAYSMEMSIPTQAKPLDEAATQRLQLGAFASVMALMPDRSRELLEIADGARATRDPTAAICRNIAAAISIWDDSSADDSTPGGPLPRAWLRLDELGKSPGDGDLQAALEAISQVAKGAGQRERDAHQQFLEGCGKQLRATSVDTEAIGETLGRGIAPKVISGENKFYGKPIALEVIRHYQVVIGWLQLIASRESVKRLGATAQLLERISAQAKASLQRAGACTFESLTRAVAESLSEDTLGEIMYRLDGRINHLMLDEFQDTSTAQWRALKPLAQSIAAGGDEPRSLLAVGDVKQSIYGWRSADPRLLRELPDLLSEGERAQVVEGVLNTSYRSSPVVLKFVDGLFQGLARGGPGEPAAAPHPLREKGRKNFDPTFVTAMDKWLAGYQHHSAAPRNQSLPGTVQLRRAQGPDKGAVQQCAARLAVELWEKCNGTKSIAVIAAANKVVGSITHAIRASASAPPCSMLAGGSLESSPAVVAVMDALRFAARPDDTASLMSVVASPLGGILELDFELTRPVEQARTARSVAALRLREELARHGPARCIARWIASVEQGNTGSSLDASDRRRIEALIEQVAGIDAVGASLEEVVASLEAVRVQDGNSRSIQAINIHQAKGLEWDIVIFVPSDRPPKTMEVIEVGKGNDFLDPSGGRIAPHMSDGTAAPEVQKVIDSAKVFRHQEFLSQLYVALTRAKQGLYLVLPAEKEEEAKDKDKDKDKEKVSRTHACLLEIACKALGIPDGDQAADDWIASVRAPEGGEGGRISSAPPMPSAPAKPRTEFKVARSAADLHKAQGGIDGEAPTEGGSSARALAIGTITHIVCQSMEWIDSWQPDAAQLAARAMRSIAGEGGLTAEQVRHAVDEAIAALRASPVRDCLARPEEPAIAMRERPFLTVLSDGSLRQGSIDRLVLFGAPGAFTRAHLIDFKTDRPEGVATQEWLEQRIAHHRAQLEAYVQAVEAEYPTTKGSVKASLVFLSTGQVGSVVA